MSVDAQRASGPPRVPLYNRPTVRAAFYQFVLLAAVLWFGYEFALNAKANLEAQKITSGFGFLENTAGFGVNQSLIPYNESDTYGRVFLVGLLNTLLVAGVGIVLATMRLWGLLWSTRIRAASQFPQMYSTVGSAASSTGGALAIAAMASSGGTILSVF